MKVITLVLISILFLNACKSDQNKATEAAAESVEHVKKPMTALAEKLYVNYVAEPKTQAEIDENDLIDYAVDNELDVTRTASGLYYIIEKKGLGPNLIMGQPTKAHYSGAFLDGKIFDSSYDRGRPLFFSVGQMIPGWNEALQLMNTGSKAKLLIPSRLAYGEEGFTGFVPPNKSLVFDLEILPLK